MKSYISNIITPFSLTKELEPQLPQNHGVLVENFKGIRKMCGK